MDLDDLAHKATTCKERFGACINNPALKDHITSFRSMQGEFNLWCLAIKATYTGKSSLDYRLRGHPETHKAIWAVLASLATALGACEKRVADPVGCSDLDVSRSPSVTDSDSSWDAISGDDSDSCASQITDPDIKENLAYIRTFLDQLTNFSLAIRKAGVKYRFAKADAALDKDAFATFRAYLTSIIRRAHFDPDAKFLSAAKKADEVSDYAKLTQIQQRLVEVNVLRRHRIEFTIKSRTSKQQARARGQESIPPAPGGLQQVMAERSIAQSSKTCATIASSPVVGIAKTAAPSAVHTAACTATDLETEPDIRHHLTETTPSRATNLTKTGSSQIYPSCPKLREDGNLVCPYCHDLLPRSYAKHESKWKSHVAQEILPYSCFIDGCDTPYETYLTAENLLGHMIESHSSTFWVCHYCEALGSPLAHPGFRSEMEWANHLETSHHGKVPAHERHVMAKLARRKLLGRLACPLCDGFHAEGFHSKIDNHILQHLHEFALLALPNSEAKEEDLRTKASKVSGSLSHTKAPERTVYKPPEFSIISAAQYCDTVGELQSLGLKPPIELLQLMKKLESPLSSAEMEYLGSHLRRACDLRETIRELKRAPSEPNWTSQMIEELITETWTILTEILSTSIKQPSQLPFHVGRRLVYGLPPRKRDIMQRDELLADIDSALFDDSQGVLFVGQNSQPKTQSRVALTGESGVGKTAVALELVYQAMEHRPNLSVFWINAVDETSIRNSLLDIWAHFGKPKGPTGDPTQSLIHFLTWSINQPWLMVLDELVPESLQYWISGNPLPGALQGRLLFTLTQDLCLALLGVIKNIPVPRMTIEAQGDGAKDLANQLRDRFLKTGAIADLEEAIQITRRAVNAMPNDHPDRAAILNSLGAQLGDRYSRTKDIANLEEAIELTRQAVATIPEDHPDRAGILKSLGIRLSDRYLRTKDKADIEEAIHLIRQAINCMPEDHPDRAVMLNSLGNRLGVRYSITGVIADLDEAIWLTRQAVNMVPNDHPDKAAILNSLGNQLSELYLNTGAIAKLEEAIQITRQAVNIIQDNHPDRTTILNNLGNQIHALYPITGAIAYLEEATQLARQVVNIMPEDHPDRAAMLNSLGNRLGARYSIKGAIADREESNACYQSALRQLNSPPITRIQASRAILESSPGWQETFEALRLAVSLVPKLLSSALEHSDKQHALGQVAGLASDAAAAALMTYQTPLVALSLLEQGRDVLGASLEEMRTDIQDLQQRYPEVAERFVRLRDKLGMPATLDTLFPNESHELGRRARADRRNGERNEEVQALDDLINETRKVPGFEGFLLPPIPSKTELQSAASHGPIVVINVSKYRCDALLVEQHQVRNLALVNLSSEAIEEKAIEDNINSFEVLEWLWDTVTGPILDALGFTQGPSDDTWPRVWWIPTGLLSKFPLHAAGRHIQRSSESVLDRVMSSYSPSIKAIIYSRRRRVPLSTSEQVLLVAMEHTPGLATLPFVTKEVDVIRNICLTMSLNPVKPARRRQDILSHLLQCNIFHFAGHSYKHKSDPSQSCLVLEDWENSPLRVADLLEINLCKSPPFLAYLSSSGTGSIEDMRFVDESITLIRACQLMGFRHVLGTLWVVSDEMCVEMAGLVYGGIRDRGMTDDSICSSIHRANRLLRDRWIAELVSGELGGVPLSRDIVERDEEAAPAYWAAYVHFGI